MNEFIDDPVPELHPTADNDPKKEPGTIK